MDTFISLGSNLGDRLGQLIQGVESLENAGFGPLRLSSVWHSEAVDTADGNPFLNMVVQGSTAESPLSILDGLLEIERLAGRTREIRNGPRPLDLDLLLVGDLQVAHPRLSLPHLRMWQRRFVLAPLAELAGQRVNPASGRTVDDELQQLGTRDAVQRLGELVRV